MFVSVLSRNECSIQDCSSLIPVPDGAWEIVSLDFIEGLPLSGKYNCILVVIDSFSKYGHFIPLRYPFTAAVVAEAFMDNVYKLHSMPLSIISDRDRIFTSQFWTELFKLSDTQLRMSTSYHPQTDGQTERVNQSVECFLRCFIHAHPARWAKWLHLCEFWYNTNWHSALGKTPFEVVYGHQPRHFGIVPTDAIASPDLEQWLANWSVLLSSVQQHLVRAKQRMKQQADKNRSERSFLVGDKVFLKIQPYVQSSLATRVNQKLSFKYYGPYQVLERVGSLAYRLSLPEESKIHPVIHVSQLNKEREYMRPPSIFSLPLPSPSASLVCSFHPFYISSAFNFSKIHS